MKYSLFAVAGGTVWALIHFLSRDRIVVSVTLPDGAFAVITFEPIHEPWWIALPETLYSASWSISGLARMALKKSFTFVVMPAPGSADHFFPQKTVNTSTLVSSGPPPYTSFGF